VAKAPAEIRSLARSHTETCINVLSSIAKQKSAPAAARVHASAVLLDRGWGKPHQTVSGEDGKAIEILVRTIVSGKD
jgi:hypothetical protein